MCVRCTCERKRDGAHKSIRFRSAQVDCISLAQYLLRFYDVLCVSCLCCGCCCCFRNEEINFYINYNFSFSLTVNISSRNCANDTETRQKLYSKTSSLTRKSSIWMRACISRRSTHTLVHPHKEKKKEKLRLHLLSKRNEERIAEVKTKLLSLQRNEPHKGKWLMGWI